MEQSAHDVRRANWLNIINQCQSRPSDMSVKEWLTKNNVKEKAYNYWLRKFRKEAYNQTQLPAYFIRHTFIVTFTKVGDNPLSC